MVIKVIDCCGDNSVLFGSRLGKSAFELMKSYIDDHPESRLICLSLEGIIVADTDFYRESIMAIISHYRGKRYFVVNNNSESVSVSLASAAFEKDLVISVVCDGYISYVGKTLSSHELAILVFIHETKLQSPTDIAEGLFSTVQSANIRLSRLFDFGLLHRSESASSSAENRYIYQLPFDAFSFNAQ